MICQRNKQLILDWLLTKPDPDDGYVRVVLRDENFHQIDVTCRTNLAIADAIFHDPHEEHWFYSNKRGDLQNNGDGTGYITLYPGQGILSLGKTHIDFKFFDIRMLIAIAQAKKKDEVLAEIKRQRTEVVKEAKYEV